MTFIFTVPFGIVMLEEPAACTFKGLPTSVRPVPCHCDFDCKPLPRTGAQHGHQKNDDANGGVV